LKHLSDVIQLETGNSENVCLAFSGGVDSSLLAKIFNLKSMNFVLVSVSFSESREIDYVKKAAETIGNKLYLSHISLEELEKGLTQIIKFINYDRIALLENAVGYYFIFKLASDNGFKVVYSAQGIDELYCGYDVFKRQYQKSDLNSLIDELTKTAVKDKQIIDNVSELFNVTYCCPFLDDEFVKFSKKAPLHQKIISQDDNLRKHYIREEAIMLGLPPEIAYREKNSLQYSSGLHKAIRQLARKNGYTNKEGKNLGYESGVRAYIAKLKN